MFAILDRTLLGVHSRVIRVIRRIDTARERGDVPGWVLITIMTAALVIGIWTVAQPLLIKVFTNAVNGVTGP
jgi:hypothetical protein